MVVLALTVAAAQQLGAALQVIRHDADAGHVVLQRQPAAGLQIRRRERRIEQRVVDHLGDVVVGVAWLVMA